MKQKTRQAAKKRTKTTGSGKIFFQKSAQNHLLINKSSKAKSEDGVQVSPHRKKSVKRMLGRA